MNTEEKQEEITLGILDSIASANQLSQRILAKSLVVDLRTANTYLKRCVHKGLVKVEQAAANRYLYYLTPKGFSEKTRLTSCYLLNSFQFYRRASRSCAVVLAECKHAGWNRLILCGASDLSEIVLLWANEEKLVVDGTYDPYFEESEFLKRPVWNFLGDVPLQKDTICLITALNKPNKLYNDLKGKIGLHRLRVPDILV